MMKKIIFLLVILVALPLCATAKNTNNGSPGSRLELTTSTPSLEIAASPGVFLYYGDDGTPSPQWFVIGTVHQGGTKYFGTSQNSTSIFTQTATSPIELADLTGKTWPANAGDTASETWWSNSGWTR